MTLPTSPDWWEQFDNKFIHEGKEELFTRETLANLLAIKTFIADQIEKAEKRAVKEFAEKLKKKLKTEPDFGGFDILDLGLAAENAIIDNKIDKLLNTEEGGK